MHLLDLYFELTNDIELAASLTKHWFNPDTLRKSLPNPAVIQVFEKCQELPDTTQCVITTRTPACTDSTKDWLNQYLPLVDWNQNLHIRSDTDTISGDAFKIERLRVLQIAHMSEDNTGTVAKIRDEVPSCGVSYVSQPWNSSDVDPSRSNLRVPLDDPEIMYRRILDSREKFFATN